MKKFKVIISGGGTGGHIFPALAIAKAMKKQINSIEFLFVGAHGRMEMEKVPIHGYKIVGLWISGLQRHLDRKNLLFPVKLLHSICNAKRIIKKFKPDLAIGTGGYASAPVLYVAAKRGIPSIIQEQNSYPGLTNKLLARYVNKICVSYDKMDKFFPSDKVLFTGNPIRDDILNLEEKKLESQKLFNIDTSKPTVLVVGGSLGALTINSAIGENFEKLNNIGVNLIWQTGDSYYNKAQKFITNFHTKGINAYAFLADIDKAYAAADVIVSRAGAIAISELCCVGKPIILVPSPNVTENHQYKNAQSLVNKNAALLVEDVNANCKLVDTIAQLLKNEELQACLSSNIKKLEITDAADRIVKIALDLVK